MKLVPTSLNFNPIAQTVAHTVFAAEDGFTLKTTSLFVAQVFDRRHDNVLMAIRNLECSDAFRLLNFKESSYLNAQGKVQTMVEMTFDGFIFLVMGFNGAKGAAFKEAYIAEFNRMRVDQHGKKDQRIAMLEKYARLPILPLTDETRAQVHLLLAERVPVGDIARICRCSQATVRLLRDGATGSGSGDLFGDQGGAV